MALAQLLSSVIQWRLLHQVNEKWRNPSYQLKFCSWSNTNTRNPHINAFISKNVYSRLWKTLFQLFALTISFASDVSGSIRNTHLQNFVSYSKRVIFTVRCGVRIWAFTVRNRRQKITYTGVFHVLDSHWKFQNRLSKCFSYNK